MSVHTLPALVQHLPSLAAPSDEELLGDYLTRRSDEAFAALLGRHGPMVLNVCRRVLHDTHAAEDVFQATFLVLARRAGAIQRPAALAGFLHGVAYRLAVRARQRPVQPLPQSVGDGAASLVDALAWREVLGILDGELSQLPEQYRSPLVLCYLEGRTQDEAARQLGWSRNTLRRRIERGRQLLEARLRGRGVSLTGALAGVLASGTAPVPPALHAATLAAVAAPTAGVAVGAVLIALALGVVCCLACWGPQPEPEPKKENAPVRGLVRFGTERYRHGTRIESMNVSADGKVGIVASGSGMFTGIHAPARVFDLTDGRCLHTFPLERDLAPESVGVSPDGTVLAIKDDAGLVFRDTTTGKELRRLDYTKAGGGGRSITDWMTFTPDGKHVAITLMEHAVQLVEVATAQVTRTFATRAAASACVFSSDGKLMATGGYDTEDESYYVRLWDVATAKELRKFHAAKFPIGNGVIRSLALSPDGKLLAGGGWGDARLRLWDTTTGKEPLTFPKVGAEIVSVAYAPDGKTVAVAADVIYLYDPTTGKERRRIASKARHLSYSRDGAVLTGSVSGAIHRWDATTGAQLTPPGQDSAVEQIFVSPDGKRVFTTDQEGQLFAWEAGKPRRLAGECVRGIVESADRRWLAWTVRTKYGNSRIRLYDTVADQFREPTLQTARGFTEIGGEATVAAFMPDGTSLLTLECNPTTLRLWNLETGKELRSFEVTPPKSMAPRAGLAFAHPVCTPRRVALAPDGKTLAVGPNFPEGLQPVDGPLPLCLWDVATGKAGLEVAQPLNQRDGQEPGGNRPERLGRGGRNAMKSMDGRAYSPDGRYLVDWAEHPLGASRIDHVYVWDAVTGKAIATLAGPGAANVAFAPDSRTLAVAARDGTIRLWEVATWQVRAEYRGHRDRVTALTFGPDGRLYSGGGDTVVIGWDVRPPRTTQGTVASAWDDLAKPDARVAYAAQGRFLAEPAAAVGARVAVVAEPGAAKLQALLANLAHDDFEVREQATTALRDLGPVAAAALKLPLASAEARRRAEGLLRDLEQGVHGAGELRALRAVEVLEWLGTDAARTRLAELAKGAAEARVTRAAAAAVRRLAGR